MGESEYVAQQAADARAAISHTISAIKADLAETVDVRLWTRQYPWMAVAAAACAGFAAACAVVPTKEDQALKRLSKIERALNPSGGAPPESSGSMDGQQNQAHYSGGRQSLWTSIAKEVIGAVKPMMLSALTAGVTAKASKPDPSEQAQSSDPSDPVI
jgi:hypothetical protein